MIRLLDLFLWLDASVARYSAVAWSLFGLWFLAAILPSQAGHRWWRWNHPAGYVGLTLLMMVGFRWPGIGQNFQLPNPDESQMLAGAITLLHQGRYWGVVDCGTSGPWNMIPLVLPGLVGLPLDYTAARFIGLLFLWGGCIFAWLALRPVIGDRPARILTMPMACCFAFTHYSEFVQYTSEQAPIFFCGCAVWLALSAFSTPGKVISRPRLALTGGILSLLPFAKLQTLPFVFCLGFFAVIWIVRQENASWRSRFIDAGWLAGGAAGGFFITGLSVIRGGGILDFYQTYWVPNVKYAQAREYPWSEFASRLWSLTRMVWGFDHYLVPALGLVALGLVGWRWLPSPVRRPATFGLFMFLAGFVVVVAPGREFQHYLQFLVFPTTLFIGLLWGGIAGRATSVLGRNAVLAAVILLGVLPQVYYRFHEWNPYHGHLLEARNNAVGGVARQILAYSRPGDTMVVWGWMPTFHVQTQLPQGAREAVTSRQISDNPLRLFFQQRLLGDLEKNRPAIFVDAVGGQNFGYHDRHVNGSENTPWLHPFVAANYVLAADIDSSRIYVRKDRYAALHP